MTREAYRVLKIMVESDRALTSDEISIKARVRKKDRLTAALAYLGGNQLATSMWSDHLGRERLVYRATSAGRARVQMPREHAGRVSRTTDKMVGRVLEIMRSRRG